MSKYPLIEQMGLKWWRIPMLDNREFVEAKDLEKALKDTPTVFASKAERIADLVEEWAEAGNVINASELNEAIEKILKMTNI